MIRKYLPGLILAAALPDPEVVREAMSLWYRHAFLAFTFSPGSYFFLLAFRAIPFALLGLVLWRVKDERLHRPIFLGGTIAAFALIVWLTWDVERPLFVGGHYSSTSAITYLFIPLLAIPAAIAGVLSALQFTRRQQRS